MSTPNNITPDTRARIADHLLRGEQMNPPGAAGALLEILRAARGMAGVLGSLAGAERLEDAPPEDLAALAWAIRDQIVAALIVVEGLAPAGGALPPAKAKPERGSRRDRGPIPPTPGNIAAALASLSPDMDRDTWFRVLAAIRDEIGADGRELAEKWSQGGATFNPADFRDAWKSADPGGGITIATLWRLALDAGWQPDREAEDHG